MSRTFAHEVVFAAIQHAHMHGIGWEEALCMAFDNPINAGYMVIIQITKLGAKAEVSIKERWRVEHLTHESVALLVLAEVYALLPEEAPDA